MSGEISSYFFLVCSFVSLNENSCLVDFAVPPHEYDFPAVPIMGISCNQLLYLSELPYLLSITPLIYLFLLYISINIVL